MFNKSVVGLANATAAGWGNLGGGVTNMTMGYIFLLMYSAVDADNVEDRRDLAWRFCYFVPLGMHVFGGLWVLTGRDLPDGNIKARPLHSHAPMLPTARRTPSPRRRKRCADAGWRAIYSGPGAVGCQAEVQGRPRSAYRPHQRQRVDPHPHLWHAATHVTPWPIGSCGERGCARHAWTRDATLRLSAMVIAFDDAGASAWS